ncbi:MAG TPA: hypothetical protein VNH84_11605 [Candidatus Saccharimonadales bacterium]|nr:hypothetical protein [Candidatus Saccharimonadales bacterium]
MKQTPDEGPAGYLGDNKMGAVRPSPHFSCSVEHGAPSWGARSPDMKYPG